MKLKYLFYELLAIPLLVPLLHNEALGYNTAYVNETKSFEFYNWLTITPDNFWNFNTSAWNTAENVFYLLSYDMSSTNWYFRTYMYMYYDWTWLVVNRKNWSDFFTWYIDIFRISTYEDLPNLNRWDWWVWTWTWEDVKNTWIGWHITDILYNQISNAMWNFCFRSSDLDLSICFRCSWGIWMVDCVKSTNNYTQSDTDNTNTTFYYLDTSLFKSSSLIWPWWPWWPWTEWWPISCVNIKTQIMLYWAKYNTWMCYTNGLTFSWNQLVQTWKLSIFDIYPSYIDFREALNVYSTYCNPNAPTTQQYCENQMSEYSPYTYQFYNYLKNANSENQAFWVESEKLYQYCHLQLNFTEEEKRSECADTVDNYYATWTNEETANGNPFEWVSEWIENNVEIAVPRTWTVFDEFLEWDTRVVGITDRFWNFKELYHKITWLFKYRWTQEWIIPWYITAMIMIILLLAIFKK